MSVKPDMMLHFEESIMMAMFNCPKRNRKEIIPNGFVPKDKLPYVLDEIGFSFINHKKQKQLKERLLDNPNRNTSAGHEYIDIKDILSFLEKYIKKYAD